MQRELLSYLLTEELTSLWFTLMEEYIFEGQYIISREDFDKAIEFKREKIKKEAQQEIEKSKNIKITEENFDYAQRLKEQL